MTASPIQTDTDDDGLPDSWEIKIGLDPADPADAEEDADSDGGGVSNLTEFTANSDPNAAESTSEAGGDASTTGGGGGGGCFVNTAASVKASAALSAVLGFLLFVGFIRKFFR